MSESNKNLDQVFKASEAVDFIKAAQEWLAAAGGFDATLDSLDECISQIRDVTGAPDDEDQ